jgi:hypothetical protein
MVRTERLAVSPNRNGMLEEIPAALERLRPGDLGAYLALDRVSSRLQEADPMEFWKSSAYTLNLMDDYKLKRALKQAIKQGELVSLSEDLQAASENLLARDKLLAYQPLGPQNARHHAEL